MSLRHRIPWAAPKCSAEDGNTVHVMLNSGKVHSTEFTTTSIEIAEPQEMQGGQVTVNADALKNALQSSGRIQDAVR
ncbi:MULTISPECIES: hypothetical protein [unclassified Duganella]|uniref:hypothetical protein n=1 Tax=unclassified Duganella TaxID=2636909 RepID=UPI000B1CBB15|nr:MULTISPECIES: hypothetical protein [unclassified Duganella]